MSKCVGLHTFGPEAAPRALAGVAALLPEIATPAAAGLGSAPTSIGDDFTGDRCPESNPIDSEIARAAHAATVTRIVRFILPTPFGEFGSRRY
jgi:hypothetical protein